MKRNILFHFLPVQHYYKPIGRLVQLAGAINWQTQTIKMLLLVPIRKSASTPSRYSFGVGKTLGDFG